MPLAFINSPAAFGCAFFGYVNIPPTGKSVFKVPLRLAVTDEDEFGHA
jgi:hypothetical protein